MYTSYEDQHTIFITSRSVLLRMKNISSKSLKKSKCTFCVQ